LTKPNYINLTPADGKRHVYRVIKLDYLYALFANKENVLVRPAKWDDPFENFILKSKAQLSTGETVTFGFHNDFFGQCWTLKQASDAMWRIYSPDNKGVRIRTTISRLAKSLAKPLGKWAHVSCHIGRVQYLNEKKMLKFANTVFKDGLGEVPIARTLLVKRPAFQHEAEIRLLYLDRDSSTSGDLFRYQVDPHQLVDQIMIDPRLDQKEADALKKEIEKRTGFGGPILRSLLYAPPAKMIIPIG
jgi:hypothetical protein